MPEERPTEAGGPPHRRPVQFGMRTMLAVTAVIAFLLGYAAYWEQFIRQGMQTRSCQTNLKGIGLGLHNYFDNLGQFPPACAADIPGGPEHSWRVRLHQYWNCSRLVHTYDWTMP